MRARLEHGLPKIACLGDDLDVVLGLQHVAEARADDRVVVDDEDADRHATGTSTESVVPEPGEDSTSSRPSTSAMRSRIPSRPRPSPAGFGDPAAVVLDHRRDAPVTAGEHDAHVLGLGVLDHVRQEPPG